MMKRINTADLLLWRAGLQIRVGGALTAHWKNLH
jgi:hypothetical protein